MKIPAINFIQTRLSSLLLMTIVFSCEPAKEATLTIACAANAQFAITEISADFEKEYGIKSHIVTASSGKLTAQINEGAPFDIFISADMKFPEEVYKRGFGVGKPQVYAYGQLVLLSTNPAVKSNLSILESDQIKHIAIANAKTAPYGIAAESVLRYYGLYEKVKDKLVYGESISQSNQFISTGAAEIGFTSASSLPAYGNAELSVFSAFDEASYAPIEQGFIVVKNPKGDLEKAQKFSLFLSSEKAATTLLKYGYKLPNKQEE
jgi:molybdate transport system substrate-binding protein